MTSRGTSYIPVAIAATSYDVPLDVIHPGRYDGRSV